MVSSFSYLKPVYTRLVKWDLPMLIILKMGTDSLKHEKSRDKFEEVPTLVPPPAAHFSCLMILQDNNILLRRMKILHSTALSIEHFQLRPGYLCLLEFELLIWWHPYLDPNYSDKLSSRLTSWTSVFLIWCQREECRLMVPWTKVRRGPMDPKWRVLSHFLHSTSVARNDQKMKTGGLDAPQDSRCKFLIERLLYRVGTSAIEMLAVNHLITACENLMTCGSRPHESIRDASRLSTLI